MPDAANIFEESPDLDTFGGRFSRAREASGLSVKDLAWRIGVKMATINAWESDRSRPGSHRLSNLSGLLRVSLSWLLHGVGNGPVEERDDPSTEVIGEQLARLKRLHDQTGHIIDRIESDIDRMSAGAVD